MGIVFGVFSGEYHGRVGIKFVILVIGGVPDHGGFGCNIATLVHIDIQCGFRIQRQIVEGFRLLKDPL